MAGSAAKYSRYSEVGGIELFLEPGRGPAFARLLLASLQPEARHGLRKNSGWSEGTQTKTREQAML